MRRYFLSLAAAGLFLLSAGTAGFVFFQVASPPDVYAAKCPGCVTLSLSCPGSPCSCKFDSPTQSYYCAPPSQ